MCVCVLERWGSPLRRTDGDLYIPHRISLAGGGGGGGSSMCSQSVSRLATGDLV